MHTDKIPRQIVEYIKSELEGGFEYRTTIELFNQASDDSPPISLGKKDVIFKKINNIDMFGIIIEEGQVEWFHFYRSLEEIQRIPIKDSIRLFDKDNEYYIYYPIKRPITYNPPYYSIFFIN